MKIIMVHRPEQLRDVRRLFEEYAASLSFSLCFQNFQKELDELPGDYASLGGGLWLATTDDGKAVGCVALRPLAAGIGEMKRLYVRPDQRGTGLGKRLVVTVLEAAKTMGHDRVRLDSTPEMAGAIRLYESLGFTRIEPYCLNPIAGAIYMEIILGGAIWLRPIVRDDLPRMFQMQQDPESNCLAVTIPRSAEAFEKHWTDALHDPSVSAKAILLGGSMIGYISCFMHEGRANVGYWIEREHWGKGIASRALRLLLQEVPTRPLYAHVATSNGASFRVLQKCGFVVERVHISPATDRYPECEEAILVLAEGIAPLLETDDHSAAKR